jgi:hypothetical protein
MLCHLNEHLFDTSSILITPISRLWTYHRNELFPDCKKDGLLADPIGLAV